jgi:hypothetical protein
MGFFIGSAVYNSHKMSFKNVDMESAFRRLAERRIEDAMKEGKFDNLPGKGKPLELEPIPADENARLTWWALRIMKNNDFVPDEVRWRKKIDVLKVNIYKLKDETGLEAIVVQVNELVRKINTLGTNAIAIGVVPLDLDHERRRLRQRLGLAEEDTP